MWRSCVVGCPPIARACPGLGGVQSPRESGKTVRTVVIPCLVCGVPVQGASRCKDHAVKRLDRRPTLKKRVSRSFSTRLRRQALFRDRWACQKCGLTDRSGRKLEADHIIRLADGGEHGLDNLQILCVACHREKTHREATGS